LGKEIANILNKIQAAERLSLDEIAETIGYAREYLSRAKASPKDSASIINALKEKRQSPPSSMNGWHSIRRIPNILKKRSGISWKS
jgi:uncharacterized protein YnzC (UPF0291/DUF896 family)